MNPKFTHSVNEHALAEHLVAPLLAYVKVDAFSEGDRPLTYRQAIDRFDVGTSVRRLGRVLDAADERPRPRASPHPARSPTLLDLGLVQALTPRPPWAR